MAGQAGFNRAFRGEMTDVYFETLRRTAEDNVSLQNGYTKKDVGMFALFRTLQVLGAYGRGLVERKAHFIESIPGALNNLAELVDEGYADNYPELKRIAGVIVADGRFKKGESAGLTIKVFSFSYKKGYPVDYSGNGGGFMFDCRGMHNPGRYEEYKKLTGRDKPVIDFLEGRVRFSGLWTMLCRLSRGASRLICVVDLRVCRLGSAAREDSIVRCIVQRGWPVCLKSAILK